MKRLVLAGAGHAHALVLRAWAQQQPKLPAALPPHAPEVYRAQASSHLQSLEVLYGRVQATVLAHVALREACWEATT